MKFPILFYLQSGTNFPWLGFQKETDLELVSKELNHLAAMLHVYAGGLILMKYKKNLLLFFKKKREIHTFTLFIIIIVKSLQKEQNSTNLLL